MDGKTAPLRVGWALCGSFCTLEPATSALEAFAKRGGVDIMPIMSPITYGETTRFGTAEYWRKRVSEACGGKKIITTVAEAEPIGPKKLLDLLIIAPCTSNTLAKLALGITDTSVTMAAKAHLRGEKPVVVALATNDALAASAKNIGELMARRNVYLVPFSQDDPHGKPRSCIADFGLVSEAADAALRGVQLQPLLREKREK